MIHSNRTPLTLLGLCLLLLAACQQLPNYKVSNRAPGITEIELETRIEIDDLYGIANKEKPEGEGLLMVFFTIPSEYPGAHSPWAQMTFTRVSDTREVRSLSVYGACTDIHRDSLLGVMPGPEYKLLGKWHHRDPVLEAVYLIKQKDTAFILERHLAGKYLESDHKPLPVCGVWANDRGVKEMTAPAYEGLLPIDLPLRRTDAQTYVLQNGEGGYRMLPDGTLTLLDAQGRDAGTAVKVP